jgi:hypothetical protein
MGLFLPLLGSFHILSSKSSLQASRLWVLIVMTKRRGKAHAKVRVSVLTSESICEAFSAIGLTKRLADTGSTKAAKNRELPIAEIRIAAFHRLA